jgi:hypothetical protein
MSEQTINEIDVQKVKIKVRPIDPTAPGFMPRYRALLAVQRAFTTPAKAAPEDIDKGYDLLAEHIVEPATKDEKFRLLDSLNSEEIMDIFAVIMGSKTVPPAKGAD